MSTKKNKIQSISDELAAFAKGTPSKCGMFAIRTANETLEEAASRPDPIDLWQGLWYQGEISCLFADSGNGKSIYAVQISTHIAATEKVLYFDFELSDKQFQLRYTSDDGHLYKFPPNLYRVEINPDDMDLTVDFEDAVITNIESTAATTGAKVLVIDNLTWLCNNSEKGDMAGRLMMRLMKLKKKYGWSILVIAHTPKRPLSAPITQNDLAGSKKLYNFFDSVFAIGLSAKDPALRYIKQIKVRYGTFRYDAGNVIVCAIAKDGAFLRFETLGFAPERDHLQEPTKEEDSQLVEEVKKMSLAGKSYRQIREELGVSIAKVSRIMNRK